MKQKPINKIHFIAELEKFKKIVWFEVKKYLPKKKVPLGHYKMVREYPERQGKYFRPGLVLLGTQLFGGNPKKALLAAAAMQASEDWLLIHDDVEDHSEKRRHKPALHIMHGEELAINAGDALHMIMWKMLGDNVKLLKDKMGWNIFNKFNDFLLKATEGQYLELTWIRKNKILISQAEYLDMVKRKTAYYTVIGPLQLGAIIAGASDKDVQKIEEWGLPFGYAFQIWDDYMNISTTTKKQGKEHGGDIMEGKRTMMLSHLLSSCSKHEKKNVEKIYLKPRHQKTNNEKKYVINLMNKYGSIDYGKSMAIKFSNQAKKSFIDNTSHLKETRAKKIILAGIDFVAERES